MSRCLLLSAVVLGTLSNVTAADPPVIDIQVAAADVLSRAR